MKVEDSKYIHLNPKKIKFLFGEFYLFNNFIIGELFAGVHFDFDKVKLVVAEVNNFYKKEFKIVYIANRINPYSTDPQTWPKFQKKGNNFINATALVIYSKMGSKVADFEKGVSKTQIKTFYCLDDAVNWALKLIELEEKKQ